MIQDGRSVKRRMPDDGEERAGVVHTVGVYGAMFDMPRHVGRVPG